VTLGEELRAARRRQERRETIRAALWLALALAAYVATGLIVG
jgi:hypothetical protein